MMPTNLSPSITTREPTFLSAIFAIASSTVASGPMIQTFRSFSYHVAPLILGRAPPLQL
jgi:hypothetical protein